MDTLSKDELIHIIEMMSAVTIDLVHIIDMKCYDCGQLCTCDMNEICDKYAAGPVDHGSSCQGYECDPQDTTKSRCTCCGAVPQRDCPHAPDEMSVRVAARIGGCISVDIMFEGTQSEEPQKAGDSNLKPEYIYIEQSSRSNCTISGVTFRKLMVPLYSLPFGEMLRWQSTNYVNPCAFCGDHYKGDN